MTTDKFLETKTLNISQDVFEGYKIPYAYLKTLLDEYAQIKVNELSKSDVINQETPNAESLRDDLRKYYEPLLIKDREYQMGDDDYALSTEELTICRALTIILNDLKKK